MVSVAALDEAFQGKTTNTKGLVDLLGKKFHGDGDGSDSKIISFCELLINHKPPFVGMFDVEEISSNEAGNEARANQQKLTLRSFLTRNPSANVVVHTDITLPRLEASNMSSGELLAPKTIHGQGTQALRSCKKMLAHARQFLVDGGFPSGKTVEDYHGANRLP